MTNNDFCCEALEKITTDYDLPIYRPIMIDRETMGMGAGPWSIKLLKKTPGGNIAKRGGATLIMSYCPACGTKLTDLADGAEVI